MTEPSPAREGDPDDSTTTVRTDERTPMDTQPSDEDLAQDDALGETFVLNAIRDIVAEESTVLADETSRAVVRDEFVRATTAAERDVLREVLPGTFDEQLQDDKRELLARVVGDVFDVLVGREVDAVMRHRTRVSLHPRDVAVYNYARTGDVDHLLALDLEEGVARSIRDGTTAMNDGSYEGATQAFEDAIEQGGIEDEGLVARALAGLAQHRAGRDERALDYAEEIMHLDTDAWAAQVVALAAGADAPSLFRDGTHEVAAYLRVRAEIPAGASIEADLGYGETQEETEPEQWLPVTGSIAYFEPDRLAPTTHLRLRLSGSIDALPTIHAYYLGLGFVDRDNDVPRAVERIFLSGPETAHTDEEIAFRKPDDR